ncbi:hypothetical protein RI129_009521 [Pyrocoelia pectoralis]|uniref:Hydroxysteroid dehydrogenase-like protein 2 n=1 Tax=Pyrocoelia pectoralis TaxID=417401 RepID=A0AAN7V6Z3_9COLE
MINTGKLAGKTLFITGGSRGIGKEIALKAARDGANIVVAAKTTEPHPKLPGTIYSAVKEIEEAGGKGLACVVDVRDEKQIATAVDEAVKKFGGIDIVINNASAISITSTEATEMKRYDLMHNINTRGTFLVSKICLPYLKKSSNAHILNLSPPLNLQPIWFSSHLAYTMAKYGMSMCVLGMHEEFKPFNIAVNALWPRTAIDTAALQMLLGPDGSKKHGRKPEIVADAAYWILTHEPKPTGHFFIDDEVLLKAGITNLDQYLIDPNDKKELQLDFFLDPPGEPATEKLKGGKVGEVFKSFEGVLTSDLVSSYKCIYQFNITGEEAGKWYLNLKQGSGSWGEGDLSNEADATFTMDGNVFVNIFRGNLKSSAAFMTGKMKISGDMMKAMKLEKLMGLQKSKL